MTDEPGGKHGAGELAVRIRVARKVTDFARREATVALPAAKRAAGHAARAFVRKFTEEYAKENKKRRKRDKV